MPHGLVPGSLHASAPRLACFVAKALSLLSGILRFCEVQAKRVENTLAVPLGCRVWEGHCEGGLGQASAPEGYKDTLGNAVPSKRHPSWSVAAAGVV